MEFPAGENRDLSEAAGCIRDRACDRKASDIGDSPRREHHRHEADGVDQRNHALAGVEYDAEYGKRCGRHDEDEAVDQKIEEAEASFQLLSIAEGFNA